MVQPDGLLFPKIDTSDKKYKTITVTVTPEIYELVHFEATKYDTSMNQIAVAKLNVKYEDVESICKDKEQSSERSRRMSFRLPAKLRDALAEEAKRYELSLSQLISDKLSLTEEDFDKLEEESR